MTAPALADRSMRARRTTTCHLCGRPVLVGQRIVRVTAPGGGRKWPHAACLVQAQRGGRPVETVNLPPDPPDAA